MTPPPDPQQPAPDHPPPPPQLPISDHRVVDPPAHRRKRKALLNLHDTGDFFLSKNEEEPSKSKPIPVCYVCHQPAPATEWRIRRKYKGAWPAHPHCFVHTYPHLVIQNLDDPALPLPDELRQKLQEHQQEHRQNPPADPEEDPLRPPPAARPANGNHPVVEDPQLPLHPAAPLLDPANLYTSIHHLDFGQQIPWSDILARPITIKQPPPQCRTGMAQLMSLTADEILAAAQAGDTDRETAAWKLLLALPAMLLHKPMETRGGKRGQGRTTLTNVILSRLQLAYQGQWADLLEQIEYPPDTPKKTRTQAQQDEIDITQIQKALEDNEINRALKILHGPLQLASDHQIQAELPQMFLKDAGPLPSYTYAPDPTVYEAIIAAIVKTLTHPPKHKAAGPAGDRYEHYAVTAQTPEQAEQLARALARLAYGFPPQGRYERLCFCPANPSPQAERQNSTHCLRNRSPANRHSRRGQSAYTYYLPPH